MIEFLIIQRFIPNYRTEVAKKLTADKIEYLIGTDVAGSKASNSADLSGIKYHQLKLRRVRILRRDVFYHQGLFRFLIEVKPKVILTEAESALGTYLMVILYKLLFDNGVRTGVWCFFKLPGRDYTVVTRRLKKFLWTRFDFFVSYHSLGKEYLISLGFLDESISIATNVCATDRFVSRRTVFDNLSKDQCRQKFEITNEFVVGYIGTLSKAKRPDLLVKASKLLDEKNISVLIAGGGQFVKNLQSLEPWYTVNYIEWTDNVLEVYKAIDLLVLPGRGGIVISEALSLGVPVLVYQGDGVEMDLIADGCGSIIHDNSVDTIVEEILSFSKVIQQENVVNNCRRVIDDMYNSTTMANAIINRFLNEINYASV